MSEALFRLRGLTVAYRRGGAVVEAVRGVDLDVDAGEVVALVGESGSGKSQTALAVLGLVDGSARVGGSARLAGEELVGMKPVELDRFRGVTATIVFQEPLNALDPLYPVGSQIAAPMIAHRRLSSAQARAKAGRLLGKVGVADAARRVKAYPHELSGGERQRVMIAMAIANDPALLIADEPTSALDTMTQAQILALLRALQRRTKMALLFITHDLALAGRFADRIAVMRDGVVVECGSTDDVLARPRDDYTRRLVAARPGPARSTGRCDAPILLVARGLSVAYGEAQGWLRRAARRRAIEAVDLAVARGRTLGVVGESGSGKSTLARALMRLVPSRGEIVFDGEDVQTMSGERLRRLRRSMQIVFQDPFGSLSPRLSAAQIVAEGLQVHEPQLGALERDGAAARAFEEVGLDPDTRRRTPEAFSGGQRQRIAIARALILKPRLLILDEPTSSLDRLAQSAVLELLRTLQERHGLSMIFISHDLSVVRAMADDLVVLREGRIVESGPAETLLRAPREAYTRALVEAAG